jgi:hypothetical protein
MQVCVPASNCVSVDSYLSIDVSQATPRAVISAATMYGKIAVDAAWKRLGTDKKKYLKDQVNPICRQLCLMHIMTK